jgi:hypothetical protein
MASLLIAPCRRITGAAPQQSTIVEDTPTAQGPVSST